MDRVCCVQTLSRHRDRGAGGAGRRTQPLSRGKGADSGWRQWQGAHTGGQRGHRQGADHRCHPGDTPGDSRHRPLSPR